MGGPYNGKFFMNKKKMIVYNDEVVRKAAFNVNYKDGCTLM
jgi:hypothetical protein